MSRALAILRWLEDKSDWLSPIVVKEVRQVVRAREFTLSFGISLVAGLAVAFFGAIDAMRGNGTSGSWTFLALTGCLAFLGFAVVPLGAFNALRNERLEQTLELITLTALSPRRIVLGKLLAQAVKLGTFFAAMAPFVAMSFLLGGIDFVTLLITLVILFLWSVWACGLCLFLSTLMRSRAMSGIVFAAVGIASFLILSFVVTNIRFAGGSFRFSGGTGNEAWWVLGITTSFCLISIVNLVLLGENRLALPTENKVVPLRVGFLAQFLLIVGWSLPFINDAPRIQSNVHEVMSVFAGIHLALVAAFTVTEDLVLSRRTLLEMRRPSRWHWLLAFFRPGGGRGAAYVLAQIGVLLVVTPLFDPVQSRTLWVLAICSYICFFTGVPTFVYRAFRPASAAAFKLRMAVLLAIPAALILPDLIHYIVFRPEELDMRFSFRHLFNPFWTLSEWRRMTTNGWTMWPLAFGAAGLIAYAGLIHRGWAITRAAVAETPDTTAATAGERASADVVY